MRWKSLTLGKIIKIIEENREIIKPAYIVNFEVDLSNEGLVIFIAAEGLKRAEAKKYAEEIKKLFGADECNYIPRRNGDYAMWSIKFSLRRRESGGKNEAR